MPKTTPAGPPGREAILRASAKRLAASTLPELLGLYPGGTRAIGKAANVRDTLVGYHFNSSGDPAKSLPYETLRWAFACMSKELRSSGTNLQRTIDALANDDSDAVLEIARALTQDILTFSPDDGPEGEVAAEEAAIFLACAVAPHDFIARDMVRDFCHSNLVSYEGATRRLLEVTGRQMVDGMKVGDFAILTGAIHDGIIWQRRYMREHVPADLFWMAWSRLFWAFTTFPQDPRVHDPLSVFDPAGRIGLELQPENRERVLNAAVGLFEQAGWQAVTLGAVADSANVSRQTVIANIGGRQSLAALIWNHRHMGQLAHRLGGSKRPFLPRVHDFFRELATIAQSNSDRELTYAMLEGVFAYSVQHGRARPGDVEDPRNYVPLPALIAKYIQRARAIFRSGYADTHPEALESSALLINQVMHLAMVRSGQLSPDSVALRVMDTTLSGMLRKRRA